MRWPHVCALGSIVIGAGVACSFDASGLGGGSTSGDTGTTTGDIGTTSSDTGLVGTAEAEPGTTGSDVASGGPDSTGDLTTTSTGPGPSTDDSTGPVPPACDRALWVSGNLDVQATGDALFHQRLVDRGYTVSHVLSIESSSDDVGDNCLVVLSTFGSSSDVGTKFRDVSVPVLTMEANLYDEMQMVSDGAKLGLTSPAGDVTIVDESHPLADGASGTVFVYPAGSEIGWASPLASAQVVAVQAGDPSHVTIFGYEAGAMLASFTAPARRVGFPASEANAGGPTPAGLDLFEAAASWAAQ